MSEQQQATAAEKEKEKKRTELIDRIVRAQATKADAETVRKAAEAAANRAAEEEAEAFHALCLHLTEALEGDPKWPKNHGASGHFIVNGTLYFFQASGWAHDGKGGQKRIIKLTTMKDPLFYLKTGTVYFSQSEEERKANEVPF